MRKLKLLFSIALLCSVIWVSRAYILTAAGAYLVSAQEPKPADIIIVLGGDTSGARAQKGCQLLQQGLSKEAWMSGLLNFYGKAEGELAIEMMRGQGCPVAQMVPLKNQLDSTRDEARVIGKMMRDRGIKSYLLITSNFHTRRSGKVFREVNRDIEAIVVSANDNGFPVDRWWHSRSARRTFFYEWVKTVSYWVGL